MTQPFKLSKEERIAMLRQIRKPSTTATGNIKDKLAAYLQA